MKNNIKTFEDEIQQLSALMMPLSRKDVMELEWKHNITSKKDFEKAKKILIKNGYEKLTGPMREMN